MNKARERQLRERVQNTRASLLQLNDYLSGLMLKTAVDRTNHPEVHLVLLGLRCLTGEAMAYANEAAQLMEPEGKEFR